MNNKIPAKRKNGKAVTAGGEVGLKPPDGLCRAFKIADRMAILLRSFLSDFSGLALMKENICKIILLVSEATKPRDRTSMQLRLPILRNISNQVGILMGFATVSHRYVLFKGIASSTK